ncbi:MAG TPA: hypothetical protein VHE58_07520 [Burkholderiales bacterium]|nr:hypothetical protein [Burkholderiales bacterium]
MSSKSTFSQHFGLDKSQGELDFVDVPLNRDIALFVDPFAISQRPDRWSQDSHAHLLAFFQKVVDSIRSNRSDEARNLLAHLREPNETRFGLSRGRPQGAGIGPNQADRLFQALRESNAVKTGFLSSLEECELMIEGIGWDKISDLTTNVVRGRLAEYTFDQCQLHGVPVRDVALGACFSLSAQDWVNEYLQLPVVGGKPILLVPKAIARFEPSYDHQHYYRHFALEFLQAQHLAAGSNLVHALKNGKRKVYKKDLQARYPCTKDYLFQFSKEHPEVLVRYRQHLEQLEKRGIHSIVEEDDEPGIASALRAALAAIPPGNAHASSYHKLMVGILEFLFFPALLCPRKEQEIHQGRKRIDVLMENGATIGIFYRLHATRKLPSAFVAFECKNYTTEINNPELDQIAGRFSPNRGRVGFICCRHFEDRARFVQRCRDTLKDDRGLVAAVDDATIDLWLSLIEARRRRDLDSAIARVIDEVWIS